MIETIRSSVQTWECDMNNHMNVRFYVMHAVDSLVVLGQALGLGPEYCRQNHVRLIAQEHHIRYLRERIAGDPIVLKSGVLSVEGDNIHIYQEMCYAITGEVAATFTSRCQLIDMQKRTALPLPTFVDENAKQISTDVPEHGAPRGIVMDTPRPAPDLQLAEQIGMINTLTAVVSQQFDDGYGCLQTTGFMGYVSDAVPVAINAMPGLQRSTEAGMGGAALEYRFIYRHTPKVGDILTLRSGLKAIGNKTFTWCHWLFNTSSGDCLATAEAVVVSLDLKTRRAITPPESVKQALKNQVIADLGV